jgi:signal transduction histidine kinase
LGELTAANEKLKELDRRKSDFTSMVSHELRTPLASLKEAISLVSDGLGGEINEKQKEILGIADNNLMRLSRFINHVLDYQKLDVGKMDFHMKDNDINASVKEVRDTMFPFVQKKGLDFILQLDENLPKIKFDYDRIVDVLLNLVNNSIKFTEKGSITITTRLGENFIQTSVKDTGVGIKEKDMERLFQRYEQLERKAGGTGLGLAIAKQEITAHGGKIWAESILGQGTTIHFILPVQEHRGQYGKENIDS